MALPRGLGVLLAVMMLVLSADAGSAGQAVASTIPPYAYKAAGGKVGETNSAWSVWLYGKGQRSRCWGTKAAGSKGRSEYGLCGFAVPRRSWQLAATGLASKHPTKSFFFFIVRIDVVQLRVKVGSGRGVKWYRVASRRMTSAEASRAQIARNFRYAPVRVDGLVRRPEDVIPFSRCPHDEDRPRFDLMANLCQVND